MSEPLSGVRVLDFSELLPGPFLTQNLVELGAEVIKVERPPNGDPVRTTSPGLFAAVNRGKQSLTLNLKEDKDRETARGLADSVDILVEGFRPGVMERLGLGYQYLSERNEKLIYLSMSGYGAEGPLSSAPGHDLNYLAQAGVTALCGNPAGGPGHAFGLPVADLAGSTYGLAALMAALFQREKTGAGQHLDLSLTDCIAHWLNARRGPFNYNKITDLKEQRRMALTRPAYGVFACSDGAVTIAALEGHFWKSLVKALNLTTYSGPEYTMLSARTAVCEQINASISEALSNITVASAVNILMEADVPITKVLTPEEAIQSAYTQERGLMIETSVGKLSGFPIRLSGMPPSPTVIPDLDDPKGR